MTAIDVAPAIDRPAVPATKLATALGVSSSAIRKNIRRGKLHAQGGDRYHDGNLVILTPALAKKYYATFPDEAPAAEQPASETTTGTGEEWRAAVARNTQRERAQSRADVVEAWEKFSARVRGTRGVSEDDKQSFVAAQQRKHECIHISFRSILRWKKQYDAGGRIVDVLVDGNDGSARRGDYNLTADQKKASEDFWLIETAPTIPQAWRQLRDLCKARGWEVPSKHVVRRYLEAIPEAKQRFYRHPQDKHNSIKPSVLRDYDSLRSMEIIESDHHQIDVAVACGDPFCAVGHYPWLTVWLDRRSRKVLKATIRIDTPNSKTILDLLLAVWLEYGRNELCVVDNGMDFVKALGRWSVKHHEVGRRGWKWQEVVGWTPEAIERRLGPCGVRAMFATPGNPRSKIVERWFETLKLLIYATYDSYRGALGERTERAEFLRTHAELLPSIGDFAAVVQRVIDEYNASPHSGDGMHGRTPNEVFEETRIPKEMPDEAAVALAMWQEKIKTVRKDGIELRRHLWYTLPGAVQATYFGKKVLVRYHEQVPEKIVVCDANGAFLTVGLLKAKAPQKGGKEIGAFIGARNEVWNDIKSHIRRGRESGRKNLEAMRGEIADYHALEQHEQRAIAPAAAVGGSGSVTVLDTHLSTLARQIRKAEAEITNPLHLSDSDLELVSEAESSPLSLPPAGSLLDFARLRETPSIDEQDDAALVDREFAATQLRQLKAQREEEGLCNYDLQCPNDGIPRYGGMCSEHHEIGR